MTTANKIVERTTELVRAFADAQMDLEDKRQGVMRAKAAYRVARETFASTKRELLQILKSGKVP